MKILPFVIAAVLSAASPEELLQQSRQALAGKSAALTALQLTGAHRVPMGEMISNRELTLSIQMPDRILKEDTIEGPGGGPGPTLLEGFDGEKAWNDTRQAPGMHIMMRIAENGPAGAGSRRMQEMLARYLLATTMTTQPGFEVTFTSAGQAEAPDGKADVLDGKGPGDFAVRIFLDAKTHLPLMLTYQGPEQKMTTRRVMRGPGGPPPDMEKLKREAEAAVMEKPAMVEYQLRPSEFRKVSGRMLPHLITYTVKGAVTEEIEIKKYTVNPALKADLFRKP